MIWLLACTGRCPEGFEPGPQRALEELAGQELAPVCLGELEHSVTDGALLLLDRDLELTAQGARAAHLQQHLERPPLSPGPGCLDRAIRAEARAWVGELSIREAHGLPLRYPFERAWREGHDERVVETWLWDNPAGGPHVDGLVDAYRLRCEA